MLDNIFKVKCSISYILGIERATSKYCIVQLHSIRKIPDIEIYRGFIMTSSLFVFRTEVKPSVHMCICLPVVLISINMIFFFSHFYIYILSLLITY